jgi:competence protein ComEC
VYKFTHTPLLRTIIPFIGGIIGFVYLRPNIITVFISFISFFTLLIVLFLMKKVNSNYKLRWLIGSLVKINLFFAGLLLTATKFIPPTNIPQGKALFIAKIKESPKSTNKSTRLIAHIKSYRSNNKWQLNNEKVLIYLEKDSISQNLEINDLIIFNTTLDKIKPPLNPHEFNYKNYLSYHIIFKQKYLPANEWKILKTKPKFSFLKTAEKARTKLIEILSTNGIKGKELSIASALILGYKDDIEPNLKNAYSSAGAMHVLAVSGLHVGIIFLICSRLSQFLEKNKHLRIMRAFIIISILWIYAFITGLSPSVMRAATMFSFITIGKVLNRKSNFFNTLAASAFFLLIINPLLIMEVGFQLSYLAVIGIVTIQPWVNNWFRFKRWFPKKIWEITAVSIAAQIATFPLGLLYFHQFPNYFLISNLIVIPLATSILCLGILTVLFSSIPFISGILATLLNNTIKTLNWTVELVDSLPFSLSENIKFDLLDTWLIYLIIATSTLFVAFKKMKFLWMSLSVLILFLLLRLDFNIDSSNRKKIVLYNIPKHSAINFIDSKKNIILLDSALIMNREKLLFHAQNYWINNGLNFPSKYTLNYDMPLIKSDNIYINKNYFQFNYVRIGVPTTHLNKPSNKLAVDLLILTKDNNNSLRELKKVFSFDRVIFDSSLSKYKLSSRIKEAKTLGIPYYSVTHQGAFELEL